MKIFSVDGGLYKFISRLWDVIKLNFLWLICSLPIITIGVSTIAAYDVALKIVNNDEGYVARGFFKAFKANFKQGMIIGPITALLVVALFFYYRLRNIETYIFVLGFLAAFLFYFALVYTYPLLARYENSVIKTIKNSMRISLRYIGKTIIMTLVVGVEVVAFLWNEVTWIIGFLVGPACIIITISAFALKIFKKIEDMGGVVKKEDSEENDDI